MRRILKVVVACAAIVALAWWVARLNGRVDFDVGPYTVEGGDSIAVVALLLAFVVFYGLFRLLSMVLRLHKFHAIWRGGRRRRAGELAVTRALVALAAGEKSDARREAGAPASIWAIRRRRCCWRRKPGAWPAATTRRKRR